MLVATRAVSGDARTMLYGHPQKLGTIQIAARFFAQKHSVDCLQHKWSGCVYRGVHCNSLNAQLGARALDAQRDFASVGN